jgi:uncharacterized repeat protein (TIGR03803 family)
MYVPPGRSTSLPHSSENLILQGSLRQVVCALAVVFALLAAAQVVQAQSYKVLYNFTGAADGAYPRGGLTIDRAGTLYGVTLYRGNGKCVSLGGDRGCGTVFSLKDNGSGWTFNLAYTFLGGGDGAYPETRPVAGPDGSFYSNTYEGGGVCLGTGCGTVYRLRPPPIACVSVPCPWSEKVLYVLRGQPDGIYPVSEVAFDQAGAMYFSTQNGGQYNQGTVIQMTPSDDGWTENVIYSFTGGGDGGDSEGSLIFDSGGNLYGTARSGGAYNQGLVYQLHPSGPGWTEKVLYSFQGPNDGVDPCTGLIFDSAGNLYGTTRIGGSGGGGTVFQLTPSGGGWKLKTLHMFTGAAGPLGSLVMDGSGNLYGTTVADGAYNKGSVFELVSSGGGWVFTDLYDFTAGSDGDGPWSPVTFDANGYLYGTAQTSGAYGYGVAWQITP